MPPKNSKPKAPSAASAASTNSTSSTDLADQAQLALQQVMLRCFSQSRVKNPAYSLRSFARKIDCSPAAVSEILNNKRKVSPKLAQKIIEKIGLDPEEMKQILALFGSKSTAKDSSSATKPAYSELASDQFKTVSQWYHFAILSLSETKDFQDDPKWIAERLNVRLPDIQQAIERLERLGMIKRDKRGRLEPTGQQFVTTDEIASTALRGAHAEILDLARNSLEQDEVQARDFTTMTMAVDPQRLVKAKKMIREFRATLCDFLEQGERTEVYQLSVNLFPLSRQNDPNGSK